MSSFIFFPTNEYADSTKSEEEIRQLMVDDLGSPQKNMIFLLTKGHSLQKPYVYKSFGENWKELLPYVLNLLPNESSENQTLAVESLIQLLEGRKPALGPEDLQKIFQTCVKCLYLWNWAINEKFVKVLEVLLTFEGQRKQFLQELEKIALELGKANQPIVSKVTAGRIIAIIFADCAKKLKASMVDILANILAHPQSQARRVWLTQLFPRLLKQPQLPIIQLHLQQKVFNSVYDKNEDIRLCAIQTILTHCQYFNQEEKSSRVVKLFIDSINSKHQKISVMTSKLLGQIYQKLQDVILDNEQLCLRFWQTLIQLSQSKNPTILNNFVFNLPGVLILSKSRYNVEPISEVYIELFYDNLASKFQLTTCFHVMVDLFPNKAPEFRDIVYNMFEEVNQEDSQCEEGYRAIDIILGNFGQIVKKLFVEAGDDKEPCLDETIAKHLVNYCAKIEKKKNSIHLENFHASFQSYLPLLSSEQLQQKFIPKFYLSLKMNVPLAHLVVNNLLACLSKQVVNTTMVSSYFSKVIIELGKSSRYFQRDLCLLFFLSAYQYFSIEIFQQYKMAEKIMHFAGDKCLGIRLRLLKQMPQCQYYFTKEEKQNYKAIMGRLSQTPEIISLNQIINVEEDEVTRMEVETRSNQLREIEKSRMASSQNQKVRMSLKQRLLTRKELFSIKQLKYPAKQDSIVGRKKPLVAETNILPKIKQQRRSVEKPKTSKTNGILKAIAKRA